MWIVYNLTEDGDGFINAFSTEEKARAYRDEVAKYADIREVKLDPEPPIEVPVVTINWHPGQPMYHQTSTIAVGEGFLDESKIEETRVWTHSYYARARTVERAKELLVTVVTVADKKKYLLEV